MYTIYNNSPTFVELSIMLGKHVFNFNNSLVVVIKIETIADCSIAFICCIVYWNESPSTLQSSTVFQLFVRKSVRDSKWSLIRQRYISWKVKKPSDKITISAHRGHGLFLSIQLYLWILHFVLNKHEIKPKVTIDNGQFRLQTETCNTDQPTKGKPRCLIRVIHLCFLFGIVY